MAPKTSSESKMPKEQKTPFKELSFGAKVGYIFHYYRYYILAAVLVIAAAASFIISYRRNNYDTVCSIIVVDGKITGYDSSSDAITAGFTEYLGIDGKQKRVECDYHYSLKEQALDQEAAISRSKIYMLASTSSIDGYLSNEENIDYFSTDQEVFFKDLREILTADELTAVADNIIYFTKSDGTQVPIAVRLSDTKIKTETDLSIEDPCYGVVVSAPNPENATAFIRYAFDL